MALYGIKGWFKVIIIFLVLLTAKDTVAKEIDPSSIKTVSEILLDENEDGSLDLLGQKVAIGGRASVGSSVLHENNLIIYIQDQSAGILVFSDSVRKQVNRGDSLVISGELKMYYGKPEIVVDDYQIIESESKVFSPISLNRTYKEPEKFLGMLVRGKAIVIKKNTQTPSLTISSSDTSSYSLKVYLSRSHTLLQDFNFENLSAGDEITIQGIMSKYEPEGSGETIYELLPRSPQDIQYAGIPQYYINIILWGSGILVLLTMAWVISLKRQVKSQTKDLSKALEQKETFMQEIHHRVKNNLTMMSGLLDLQIDTTQHKEVVDSLEDSKSRLHSMALIHNKLYETQSYNVVRFDKYLKELINTIKRTFSEQQESVEVHYSLEPVELPVDKAVTCGLLINELVVNAYKHAFTHVEQGILDVKLYQEDEQITLIISDNGPGLPVDFEARTDSLGSLLIHTFSSQLEAEMDIKNENGSTFSFRFPLNYK